MSRNLLSLFGVFVLVIFVIQNVSGRVIEEDADNAALLEGEESAESDAASSRVKRQYGYFKKEESNTELDELLGQL